jgi:hypothetical protein
MVCAVCSLSARESHQEYVPAGGWPDDGNRFEPHDTLARTACGLLVQPGMVNGNIPAIRTLWNTGRIFGDWELPIDMSIPISGVMPAGTVISNEVCLLLNGRFSFFLPDGEYLDQKALMPSVENLQNIADMAYHEANQHILMLAYADSGTGVVLYTYLRNGVLLSQSALDIPAGTGSLFLVELAGNVYIGLSDAGGLIMFYRNGTQVDPDSNAGLDTPGGLLAAAIAGINTIDEFCCSRCVLPVKDIIAASNSFRLSTGSVLYECNSKGTLLNALVQGDRILPENPEIYYAGILSDGSIFSTHDVCSYGVYDLAGGNRQIRYWRHLVPEAQSVFDAVMDDNSNWWLLISIEPDDTVATSRIEVVQLTENGKELQRYEIHDPVMPFSFIRNPDHPVAVVGRERVYAFIKISGGHALVEWEHGLATNSASEVIGAADAAGRIYLAVRDSETKASTRQVHMFDQDGNLLAELHFKASFLDIDPNGDVLALQIPEGFDTRRLKKFSIIRISPDNSLSEQFTLRSPENQYHPQIFITHPSGMILVADREGFTRFGPRDRSAAGIPDDMSIDMRPRKMAMASVYEASSHVLTLHGTPVERKPAIWRRKKLIKYGRMLEEDPVKAYQKLAKLKSYQKSKLKITISDKRLLAEPLTVRMECGFKRLRYHGLNLKAVNVVWGNEPAPAGVIECQGDFDGSITAASLKELSVNGIFSGTVDTWRAEIDKVRIEGKCSNAVIRARGDIKWIRSGGHMLKTLLRTGISPAGFTGHSGNIDVIRTTTSYSDCTFIACADEGRTPGWSGDENSDFESFWGTIKVIVVDIIEEEERQEPRPLASVAGSPARGRVGQAFDCTLVTLHPIRRLLIQLVDSTYIIDGKEQ